MVYFCIIYPLLGVIYQDLYGDVEPVFVLDHLVEVVSCRLADLLPSQIQPDPHPDLHAEYDEHYGKILQMQGEWGGGNRDGVGVEMGNNINSEYNNSIIFYLHAKSRVPSHYSSIWIFATWEPYCSRYYLHERYLINDKIVLILNDIEVQSDNNVLVQTFCCQQWRVFDRWK